MPTLVHHLAATSQRTPNAKAIVLQDRAVSYGELWANVIKVGQHLRQQGLEPGQRVATLMENSPEYVACYYGTLSVGGIVVALNPADKAKTHRHILKHCDVSYLISDGTHRELAPLSERLPKTCGVITLGEPRKPLPIAADLLEDILATDAVADDIELDDLSAEQLATIIYTSGTTGDPKGVMLSHNNLLTNTLSIVEYLGLSSSDSIVNVLPFNYSYGNSVLHTHLMVGGKIILENSLLYPRKVLERMEHEKTTGFSGVPSTFALMLDRLSLGEAQLQNLRYITQAGGPMPAAHIERLQKQLPAVAIFVMYGQTEASARLTYLPAAQLKEKLGSCGIPIPGVEIEIRDKDGHGVTQGESGEIYARGTNVMQGYWKNPKATEEVLIDGWLKTGDQAHQDSDGFVFIEGRSSDMIKSGAHRIKPQEIEETISELEGIVEVGVVGVPDDFLGQAIKAAIVLRKNSELDMKQVQRYCKQNLAQYKIPKQIVFLNELPKTSSGKIQRQQLVEL